MKNYLILGLWCLLILTSLASVPTPSAQAASDRIIAALRSGDYLAFINGGNEAFKKLKKEQFDSVVKQLAPRFNAGYEVTFLGEMKQQGFEVSLWKFYFKDGGDDLLGTLSLKDGAVGGYWIK
jgi:flavodoxin